MSKRVAVINDLSGLGRCSLTAAISVLSAMGLSPCPLPTAILTAQTGYPDYYCDDYTDKIPIFMEHWKHMNISFDGICTGFVTKREQITHIVNFIDCFDQEHTKLLVDPVMGDNGHPYPFYTSPLGEDMRHLASMADIITPNLTEFCMLTGLEYDAFSHMTHSRQIDLLVQTGSPLCQKHHQIILITGIIYRREPDGPFLMGNLYLDGSVNRLFSTPYVKASYSGTGDLFSSAMMGSLLRGDDMLQAVEQTNHFLEMAIQSSLHEHTDYNDGVNYEPFLTMLSPGKERFSYDVQPDNHETTL